MINNNEKNKKSKITLSLDPFVLEELKNESKSQGISVNAKINNVLTKYSFFYRYSEEQESLVMLDSVVLEYLEMIDEKEFLKILNQFTVEMLPAIFRQHNIELSLDNVIKHCFQQIALWAGMYRSFRYSEGNAGSLNLVFEHKYGIKWSRIIGNGFCNFIETLLNYPTKLQTFQNSFVIKVETR
jgi:hypothetical protein